MGEEKRRQLVRTALQLCAGLPDDPAEMRFVHQIIGEVIESLLTKRVDGPDARVRALP